MEIILRKKKQVKDIISHKDLKISGSRFRLGRGADQDIHLPNSRVGLEHAILKSIKMIPSPLQQPKTTALFTTT